MAPTLTVTRGFAHADGIYGQDYPPGSYRVVDAAGDPKAGTISKRGCEVALQNAWGALKAEKPAKRAKGAKGRKDDADNADPDGAGADDTVNPTE
ncbi:MAG TPA: hypothetical protein VGA50_04540 [Kiloniellales bacterium]